MAFRMRRQGARSDPGARGSGTGEIPPAQRSGHRRGWKVVAVAAALCALAALPYLSVRNHDFINFDDDAYVTLNPQVRSGLTAEGVRWAFTTFAVGNWHPLTWLSLMADVELFGTDPGRLHLVNVFLHAANAALLFLALFRMTGAMGRSAFAAALFAVHPLHVESVAWVAERKDVLSGLFFTLVLLSYGRYARAPGIRRYLPVAAALALGLMAKPMLVTVPFLLLLLDVWPLGRTRLAAPADGGRWDPPPLRRVLLEKVPLLVLAAGSCLVTYAAQSHGGMTRAPDFIAPAERIANALVSYVAYIEKMFWPQGLAVLYPFPWEGLPLWKVAFSALVLAAVSAAAARSFRRVPFLPIGWLWYLGALVPVIGLIPVGNQAMADRYTYLPLIGLFVMVSWGLHAIAPAPDRRGEIARAAAALALILALAAASRFQVDHWRNNESLYVHALKVTSNNGLIHNSLGVEYFRQGRIDEAVGQFREAVRIRPDHADAHNNLGLALSRQGRFEEAMAHMREAYRLGRLLRLEEYGAPPRPR